MMEKVIEVSHLTKEYKNLKAIDDLSFNVYQGEILGLLGPNGCGKSTTINSILSLLKYQEGFIKVFGKEMKPDSYDLKAKIGVIFQEVAVFDELNVFDIALKDELDLLNLNGRISVITFHSLEDKICKYTFNEVSKLKDVPKGLPVIPLEMQPKFKLVNRKPIIASDDELTHNHRAHSAKLRVIERVILWKRERQDLNLLHKCF